MRRRIIVRQVNNQARPVRLATLVGSAVAVALGFAGGPAHAASGPSGAPPSVAPLISSEAVRPDTMGAAGVLPISAPDASQAVPDLPPPIVKSDPIVPIAAGKGMQPLATGGGLPGNGYYRFVDSDEVGNPEAPVSNFRDIRTLGTVVAGISDDECVSVDLSAGALPPFTFKYFDVDYTTVFVCGNGQISFGAADNRFSNLCPPTGGAAVGGAIFGLWDDWRVAANGRILTYTFGTAPNRVFVAQWEQVSSFAEPAETDTFQIQLLERSGDIRVEYQNVDSGQPDGLALYPSPDNHYLVGSETGDKLTRFQAAGAFDGVHVRSGEAGLDGPSGVAIGDGVAGGVGDVTVDGVDDVFVGSFNTDQIMVYNGSHPGTQLNDGYFLTPFVAAGSGGLDGPRGVRFGPDGNLYVSSFNNDRVLKYNGTTGASISTFVAAGAGGLDGPDDLVFGPDGNLYVSSYNNDRVIKYDGTTGAVIGTFVAAGSGGLDGPRGLAFGAADGNLYVASENTDQVLRYAGGNGDFFNVAVAAGQNGLNEPRFIQFNSTGNLLVVSHGSNRVLEFSVPLVTFLTGALPSFPEGVAFNGGFLYVSSRSTSEVLRYNATTGAFVGVFVTSGSGGLNGPQDLVFGPTGDLYVSSIASNEVKRYNGTTGAFISTFVTAGLGGLDQPHGLRFGTGGDLFVASENSHEIKRYNGTTGAFISNFVTASSGGLTFPHGIVFNAGDLYVSSFGTDQVKRYNGTTGAFISNFVATGSGGLDDPVGLVFGGPSNDLFVVSNVNSRVLAYNGSTGAFIGTFAPSGSGGLSGPRMLTFGPDGRLYISSRFTNQVMTTAATFVRAVDTGGDRSRGRSATVGLDGPNGTLGLQYACNPGGGIGAPIVKEDLSVLFVAPPPAGADLRVVYKRVNNPMPTEDEVITYEIKIQNDGRFNATGVTVLDQLPSELTYVSSSATAGSYNSGTGIWTVGSLALAQMETLTIQARVNQGTARTPGRFDSEFVIADGSPSPAAPFGRLRRPDGIVRDPVTGNWLVSSFDTDQILRYSSTGAFVNILVDRQPDTACSTPGLGCLRGPVGLVIRAGLLYVASSETNQVLRFDAATGAPLGEFVGPNPLFPYPNGIAGPRGLVFDASGNLYVSNALNSQVRRYSPGGGFTGVVAANKDDPNPGVFGTFPNSTLSGPDGIVFGPDRNGDAVPDLYVASRTSTEILVFDVVTSSQIGTGALFNSSDGLSGPSGIALSADQRFLYVANFGLNQILQLDLLFPTTGLQLVATAQGGLLSPEAIAIQPNGDLLVASTGSHQILGFGHTVTGAFEGVIASTGVNGVRALKVGPTDQRLYAAVLDPSSSAKIFIRRYDPTTNIEDSSPFFNGDVLTSACAIGIGSVNFVYDMEMSPDGKLVFLSVGVSCISGFTSAIVILNGPTGSSPGTIAGVVRFSGATAFGLAIGPNNDLFVARDWTGFLSPPDDILRLDGATGAFIGVFASGGLINAPRGLTYAPDGNLYLANRGPNTILRIDGTTAAVTDPAGFNPVGGIEDVQYGPDGNLYGTTHPGAVERWSLVTGTAVPSFGGGILNVPGDIVFLAEGDVVVADTGNNRIVRFDGHAQFQGVFAQVRYGPTTPGLNCARYLTFGPDGNMYVSSEYTDRVLRYNGTTGAFIDTFVDETSGLDGPRDIVFGPDGKFYVASRNNDRILRYNGTTGVYDGSPYVPGAFFGSGGLSGPEAMAFGPDDDLLYVSSNLGNQILRYFDVGSIFGAFPIPPPFVDFGGAPSLIAPRGLAFGPDGDLYVSTPSGIFQYARSTGAFVQIFSHGGPLAGAADLTFGPDGNLYVVSSGSNEVLVYQGPQVAMPMSPGDYLGSFLITEPGEPAPIEPTGLVFGPNGDLFVSSCGSHNVIRYRGFIANRAIVDGTSNPAHVPNDPNLSNNVGTVAVTVKGADFEIQKTVDDNTPYEGDTVTYTVSVTNHGPLAGIQVQVTDVLPPQLTYVGSTPSQGSYNPGTGFWTIGALPVDATATLTIQATVNNGVAVAFPVVTNTATVDDLAPTVGDPDLRNNTASVDIFLVFADLAVTKSVDLATANEGQTVEFTINVVNNGLNDATGVQIRDRLPSGLAFVSATTPPGTTYNPISGLWVIGNLANGANLTLLLRGQVLTGTGGLTLTNAATVAASSLPDPDPSNDTATADVTVRGADLSIVKTVSPPPPGGYTFGTPLTFTIVVTNNGPLNATGVTARDRLPIGLTYISHVASGGTYDPVSGVWMIGALAASATRTLTINATFAASASGSVANIATVSAQTGDQNLENNRSAVVIGVPNIDLDIIIVSRPAQVYPDPAESAAALDLARRAHDVPADDANAEPPADVDGTDAADPDATTPRPPLLPGPGIAGNGLFYDITVRNDGKSTATGVVLTAILDPDVHYITDNDVPQCVEAPVGTLKCQFGAIEAGGSKTITVQTEVEPQAYVTRLLGAQPLVLTLRASVMADQQDTDILDDVEVHLTHLVDLADARIFKVSKPDDAVRAGQIFTYTLLVENLGPSLARDLQFDDSILSSGVFTLVGTQLDPGRDDVCVAAPAPAPLSGQILRCTLNEPLEPVGSGLGTGRWTVQVTARATQTQDIDNEVRLYSRDGVSARVGTPDPRLGNNVAVDSISILDTSDLRLTKSEVGVVRSSTVCATTTNVPNNVTAGEQLTWTIVVTNGVPAFGLPGGSIATNVTVFDAVPAGLEIVSIAGVGPAAAAAGCHAGTPGDPSDRARCVFASLAPGASGTVTIVARVDAGYVGASGTNQIVNSAWTSSDNIDPFQDDNVATQITAVSEVADLSIQKLATPNPVIAGQALSYELVIANAGPSNGRSVLVRDVLPAQLAYVSARIENQRDREQCTFSEGANEVICSLFDVPVGEPPVGGRRVFINTVVRPNAAVGNVANTATVSSGGTPDCNAANNSASISVPVQTQADVSVTKSVDPVKVAAGRQVKYTVVVTNNGPSDAQNVVVTDTLPPEVTYEIDTLQPMCTLAIPPAVPQVLTCQIGTLAVGATRSFDIWALVHANIPSGTTITNNVSVASQTSLGDPVPANNTAFAKNFVLSQVDLTVSKFGTNDGRVRAGQILTYTVIVDNHGPSFGEGVALKDVLQAGEQFDLIDITSDRPAVCKSLANGATETNNLAGTPWPPALAPAPPFGVLEPSGLPLIGQRLQVDCTLNQILTPAFNIPQLGVLLADGPPNTGRWILTMRVRFRQAQDITNVADVVSTSEELDPTNNHAEVRHEITDVANLSVTKTALGEVQVNGQAGRILNTQSALPVLPEAPFYVGSPTQVTAGRRIRYTIRVQNSGPSDAENVLVTDRLPNGVTVLPNTVRVNVDNLPQLPATACQTGTPGSPIDQLTCGLGTLLGVDSAQRRGATIVFDVLVDPGLAPGAVLENDVEVRSDVFDSTTANNHAHVQTTVLSAADLSTSKTAMGQNVTGYDVANARFVTADQVDRVTAGLTLRYELSVQNAGPSVSRNVTLRDVLPAGVTFLRTDGGVDCRADSVNGGTLYCTAGDMAPGERRTFSLFVLVDRAIASNTVLQNCTDALFAPASPPAQPSPLPPLPPTLSLTADPLSTNNQACDNTTVNAIADIGGPGPNGTFGAANDFIQKVDVPAEPRLDRLTEPDFAIAGKEHRYRITFGNAGPSTAVSVVVTDTLDFKQPALTGERFVRCEPLDPDDRVTCTYNAATNVVTLQQLKVHNETIFNAGVGTLPPGIGFGFDLITLVDPGYVLDAANTQAAGPLNSEAGAIARNTVFMTTATTDFRRQNNRDTERTRIIAEADLAITKTDIFGDFLTCDPVTPGGMVTYQIVATNNGPSDAAEVFVVDQLPIDAIVVDPAQVVVTVSEGEVVEVRDDGRITVRVGNGVNNAGQNELGRLNAGASVTITVRTMVRQAAKCGTIFANVANVETRRNDVRWPPIQIGPVQGPKNTAPTTTRTATLDPNPTNNRAVETTTVACPSITVDKTVSFDGTCPGADYPVLNETGQPVTFCFEIKNTGTTYLDDIRITDTLKSRSTMPTIVFTDTVRFGVDPKVPVAPGETVRRQVTVAQLTRECGNAVDSVEVSANPVNSGRTDLSCLPIVTASDSARIEVPCAGVDYRLQLPILGGETCQTWIQVQNVGDHDTIPVLVVWGDAGFCPPQSAGPLKVECSGLLRPGSAWSFATSQIPSGAHSAVVYSLSADTIEEEPGQPIAFGRLVCDRLYNRVTGSDLNWLIFDTAYRKRGTFEGYDFSKHTGEPLAVVVNRGCPDPTDPNRTDNAAYEGISSDMEGAYDPESGGFTTYAPFVVSGQAGLNSILHVQNSGELCTSLEIWFKSQDSCLRPILGDVIQLSRGETVDFDPATVVGAGFIGSAWIRASQPLGVVVDTMGPNHFTSYVGVPADVEALGFSLGDQINYAPLIYNEYQGWDTAIQVQNLSATMAAKVKVYFLDFGGGIKQTLVDWICPRGSNSFFSPVIAGLPGTWTGSARVESQEWWNAAGPVVDPPRIQSIVVLERWADPARSERREAVAYNAATETLYDWQLGNGKGGVASGSAVFALPMISKRNRGVSAEVAIANLVPKPGFTNFAIFLYDQNGLIDFVCETLGEKQVEYINVDSWGWVRPSFLGSMVVSATFWEHEVFDDHGVFVRNLVGLGAVGVERVGGVLGEPDIPGDESKAYESFPLFDNFLLEDKPACGP